MTIETESITGGERKMGQESKGKNQSKKYIRKKLCPPTLAIEWIKA